MIETNLLRDMRNSPKVPGILQKVPQNSFRVLLIYCKTRSISPWIKPFEATIGGE